jgi:hypothetical protein
MHFCGVYEKWTCDVNTRILFILIFFILHYIIIMYNITAPRTPMRFCSNGSTGHIDIYLYMSHPLNVIVFFMKWISISWTSQEHALNYTCDLTLMYRHGERLMFIVFDNGECTINYCGQDFVVFGQPPHRSWYYVTIVLLAVGNIVCIRSPSISRNCTGSTVRGNSSWVDTADIFIPSNSTRSVFAINTSSLL